VKHHRDKTWKRFRSDEAGKNIAHIEQAQKTEEMTDVDQYHKGRKQLGRPSNGAASLFWLTHLPTVTITAREENIMYPHIVSLEAVTIRTPYSEEGQ
jgi:hypothetical protein